MSADLNPASAVKWIVIHYSATPIERDVTVEDINAMHIARGFKKIGYHFYIRKNGTVNKGRMVVGTTGDFETGAHSKGENTRSVGIAYEGGVTLDAPNSGFDTRTPAQIKAMVGLIDRLRQHYLDAKVTGHRDMPGAATQCPGFDASAWWADVERKRKPPTNFFAVIIAIAAAILAAIFS